MALRGWTWDAALGPAGLGNRPLLEALAAALPDQVVDAAIEQTGTRERRRRRLPTHLVVTLVVALGLWAEASLRHALAEVVGGWREGAAGRSGPWQVPSSAAIVPARQRAGARLCRVLFHAGAGPIATRQTRGAFLGGLRLMAGDGTTLDVADTPTTARAFGRPGTGRGPEAGAFPQLRAIALIETGTHALCDVVLRPYRGGEGPAARRLLRSVGPGRLLLWERNFARPAGAGGARDRVRAGHRRRARGGALAAGHLAAGRAGLPGRRARRGLPRAVGDRDDAGRGAGPPVGTPPAAAQPAPAGSGAGGLGLAAGAPGHPHRQAPGRPAGAPRPGPTELHRGAAGAAPGAPAGAAPAADGAPPFPARLLTDRAAARLPPRRPRSNPRAVKRKMSNFPRKPPRSSDTAPASRPAPPVIRVLWPELTGIGPSRPRPLRAPAAPWSP